MRTLLGELAGPGGWQHLRCLVTTRQDKKIRTAIGAIEDSA